MLLNIFDMLLLLLLLNFFKGRVSRRPSCKVLGTRRFWLHQENEGPSNEAVPTQGNGIQ